MAMNDLLAGVDEIILPAGHGPGHGSHLYIIRVDTDKVAFSRDTFSAHLKDAYGVATAMHYPAVWSWEAFSELGYSEATANCPIAAAACSQVVSLPIIPSTSPEDLEYIAWAIKQTVADLNKGTP